MTVAVRAAPLLLYNDECSVCRAIAGWVQRMQPAGAVRLVERPIGDDPEALRALNPQLDIWDAYATIHLLMPDGSMKLGGEAVAGVLRALPVTAWFTGAFGLGVFGVRPFQLALNGAYEVLAAVRPLFGCESCGTTNAAVRSIAAALGWLRKPRLPGRSQRHSPRPVRRSREDAPFPASDPAQSSTNGSATR